MHHSSSLLLLQPSSDSFGLLPLYLFLSPSPTKKVFHTTTLPYSSPLFAPPPLPLPPPTPLKHTTPPLHSSPPLSPLPLSLSVHISRASKTFYSKSNSSSSRHEQQTAGRLSAFGCDKIRFSRTFGPWLRIYEGSFHPFHYAAPTTVPAQRNDRPFSVAAL